MIEKIFRNTDMDIELTSFIDDKQNVWLMAVEIAKILGYNNIRQTISRHVDDEDKQLIGLRPLSVTVTKLGVTNCDGNKTPHQSCPGKTPGQQNDTRGKYYTFINEPGLYSLILSLKLEAAKKFKHWVTSQVLPSIRKYGQYKLFNNPSNKMFMIGNETDLHYKVEDMIRRFYPDSLLVAGLGENQDTEDKRLDSYKKGYTCGQPDLMLLNYHKDYKGLCTEFKSPTNNYHVSDAQKQMNKKYLDNGYAFILSNDYDRICKRIHDYMKGIRIPCQLCNRSFLTNQTLLTHMTIIYRLSR